MSKRGKPVTLSPEEIAARCAEDAQDAEMFRVLAFTGMRIGEALALQWGDVDLEGRRLMVERAVSATEEGPTKGWQVRYLPLADPAHDALKRLQARVSDTATPSAETAKRRRRAPISVLTATRSRASGLGLSSTGPAYPQLVVIGRRSRAGRQQIARARTSLSGRPEIVAS